jgi:hypothetical protein
MKSFKQHIQEQDTPHLVLGKMGINIEGLAGQDHARIRAVQNAYKNKMHPYNKKIKPNKIGNPKT